MKYINLTVIIICLFISGLLVHDIVYKLDREDKVSLCVDSIVNLKSIIESADKVETNSIKSCKGINSEINELTKNIEIELELYNKRDNLDDNIVNIINRINLIIDLLNFKINNES